MPPSPSIHGIRFNVMQADLASEAGLTPDTTQQPRATGETCLTIHPRAKALTAPATLAPLAPCAYFTDYAPDGVVHLVVEYMVAEDFIKLVQDAGLARALGAVIDLPAAMPAIHARTAKADEVAHADALWKKAIASRRIRDPRQWQLFIEKEQGCAAVFAPPAKRLAQMAAVTQAVLGTFAMTQSATGPGADSSTWTTIGVISWASVSLFAACACWLSSDQQQRIATVAEADMSRLREELQAADGAVRLAIHFKPRTEADSPSSVAGSHDQVMDTCIARHRSRV